MYSLFIGRWQPFHRGHKQLIDKVLAEGKKVCIAIRNTELSKENPYTIAERYFMIREKFEDNVEIIVVPDIDEVCYGRKAGWKIRKINMSKITEAISGTKIRRRKKLVSRRKVQSRCSIA